MWTAKKGPQETRLERLENMDGYMTSNPDVEVDIDRLLNQFIRAYGASKPKATEYFEIIVKANPVRYVINKEKGTMVYLSDKKYAERMKAREEMLKELQISATENKGETKDE